MFPFCTEAGRRSHVSTGDISNLKYNMALCCNCLWMIKYVNYISWFVGYLSRDCCCPGIYGLELQPMRLSPTLRGCWGCRWFGCCGSVGCPVICVGKAKTVGEEKALLGRTRAHCSVLNGSTPPRGREVTPLSCFRESDIHQEIICKG